MVLASITKLDSAAITLGNNVRCRHTACLVIHILNQLTEYKRCECFNRGIYSIRSPRELAKLCKGVPKGSDPDIESGSVPYLECVFTKQHSCGFSASSEAFMSRQISCSHFPYTVW